MGNSQSTLGFNHRNSEFGDSSLSLDVTKWWHRKLIYKNRAGFIDLDRKTKGIQLKMSRLSVSEANEVGTRTFSGMLNDKARMVFTQDVNGQIRIKSFNYRALGLSKAAGRSVRMVLAKGVIRGAVSEWLEKQQAQEVDKLVLNKPASVEARVGKHSAGNAVIDVDAVEIPTKSLKRSSSPSVASGSHQADGVPPQSDDAGSEPSKSNLSKFLDELFASNLEVDTTLPLAGLKFSVNSTDNTNEFTLAGPESIAFDLTNFIGSGLLSDKLLDFLDSKEDEEGVQLVISSPRISVIKKSSDPEKGIEQADETKEITLSASLSNKANIVINLTTEIFSQSSDISGRNGIDQENGIPQKERNIDITVEYNAEKSFNLGKLIDGIGLTEEAKNKFNQIVSGLIGDDNPGDGLDIKLKNPKFTYQHSTDAKLFTFAGSINKTEVELTYNSSDKSFEAVLPNNLELDLSQAVSGLDVEILSEIFNNIAGGLDRNDEEDGVQLLVNRPSISIEIDAEQPSLRIPSISGTFAGGKEFELSLGSSPRFSFKPSDSLNFGSIEVLSKIPLINSFSLDNPEVIFSEGTDTINNDSLGNFGLVDGFNVRGTIPFENSANTVAKFLNDELGVKSVTVGLGIGSENVSLKGSASLDKLLFGKDEFSIRLKQVGLGMEFSKTSLSPTLALDAGFILSGYDPTQLTEPDLDLLGDFELDIDSITGGLELKTRNGITWSNPFGLTGANFEALSVRFGGSYTTFINEFGLVADIKLPDGPDGSDGVDLDLAFSFKADELSPLAFELTLENKLSLFAIPGQFGSLLTSSVGLGKQASASVKEALASLDAGLKSIEEITGDIKIVPVDVDKDGKFDPLVKFAPYEAQIGSRIITQGIAINTQVEAFGSDATLILNANPFSANPGFEGSLSISEIKLGSVLTVAGSSSDSKNNNLDLRLKFNSQEQAIEGDGSITVFGRTLADANFALSSTKIDITKFNFDIGIASLTVDNFIVDWKQGYASGKGNISFFNEPVATVEFSVSNGRINIPKLSLGVEGIISFEINNLFVDSKTGDFNANAEVDFLGTSLAEATISSTDGDFKAAGKLDLGILEIQTNLDIQSADSIQAEGSIKLFNQPLLNANMSVAGSQLSIGGGITIEGVKVANKSFGDIVATLDITTDGTISGTDVTSHFEFLGESITFELSLDDISKPLDMLGDLAKYVAEQAIGAIGEAVEAVGEAVAELGSAVSSAAVDTANAVVDFVTDAASAVASVAKGVWNSLFGGSDQAPKVEQQPPNKNEHLNGNDGNDLLNGKDGDDHLRGGKGNDTLIGGRDSDHLFGQDDDDIIIGDRADDQYGDQAGKDTLEGGNGNDFLDGGGKEDTLKGGVGQDTLLGGSGNDSLEGGNDDDRLFGGENQDHLYGNSGSDILDGGSSNDHLEGGSGDDTLVGGSGNDTLYGNEKLVSSASGSNFLDGNIGDDHLYGGTGHDTLVGGEGDDELEGDGGDDILIGGEDNDILDGGSGIDTLYGGSGIDTLYGGWHNDILKGEEDGDLLAGGSGNDTLDGGSGNDILYGQWDDDTLDGGSGNDILYGQWGDDILDGGSGNDRLFGGVGSNALRGGSGADRFALSMTEAYMGNAVTTIEDFQREEEDSIWIHVPELYLDQPIVGEYFSYERSWSKGSSSRLLLYGNEMAKLASNPSLSLENDVILYNEDEGLSFKRLGELGAVDLWSDKFIERVLQLTNEFRAQESEKLIKDRKEGLKPLTLNNELTAAAYMHSRDMAQNGHFSHTNSEGLGHRQRLSEVGYESLLSGENIAMGHTTPEAVVQSWKDSEWDRKNMLRPEFTEMGLGYYRQGATTMSSQRNAKGYLWTHVFGTGDTESASTIPTDVSQHLAYN